MRPRRVQPSLTRSAFAGFCFPPEVIILSVRWYLRFALSYRDVEEPASLGVAAAFDELALAI
jgi:IS6 family transposase